MDQTHPLEAVSPDGEIIAERVTISARGDFAYASLVTNGWSVSGIRLRRTPTGRVEVLWPTAEGSDGRVWPVLSPPPHLRDALEELLGEALERASSGNGHRGSR